MASPHAVQNTMKQTNKKRIIIFQRKRIQSRWRFENNPLINYHCLDSLDTSIGCGSPAPPEHLPSAQQSPPHSVAPLQSAACEVTLLFGHWSHSPRKRIGKTVSSKRKSNLQWQTRLKISRMEFIHVRVNGYSDPLRVKFMALSTCILKAKKN